MLRIATEAEFDIVFDMGMKFAEASPYAEFTDPNYVKAMIVSLINSSTGVILLHDGGMLAAELSQFPLGPYYVAFERALWVDPDKRKNNIAGELIEAFEAWSTKIGAHFVQLSCLDDIVGKYYEKKGYKLFERAYMKGL